MPGRWAEGSAAWVGVAAMVLETMAVGTEEERAAVVRVVVATVVVEGH